MPALAWTPSWRYREQVEKTSTPYVLDDQIGFVLRRVTQRHIGIFTGAIGAVTTTQFAALAKLAELGPLSQNHLGRVTAMDAATIKGVVDRLLKRGFVATAPDPADGRRMQVSITRAGLAAVEQGVSAATAITAETLRPLAAAERRQLLELLRRIA